MVKPRKLFGGLGNSMFQYAYILNQVKKGLIPDIYVQDEKYFNEVKDEIREMYGRGIGLIDKISLHVRRGDYINNSHYVDLSATDYYKKAMEEFPGEDFLIFCADRQAGSDDNADMKWCKEHFKGRQFSFFQGSDEIRDFNAMASCKGHIMANSSFSWWASFIGGGTTVYPKRWYASGESGIIPPALTNWIQL